MIPLRDDQPTSTFPIVTILLIVVNVLVYLAQTASGGALDASFTMVPYEVTHNVDLSNVIVRMTQSGAHLIPVTQESGPLQIGPNEMYYGPSPHPLWLTIFTSMFMHGGFLHIAGNMLYLFIFGNNIEDALGKVRFLIFYLVCGLAASLAQIAISPDSLVPNLGASGAIAGVLGAYFILYPDARVLTIVPIVIAFLAQIRAYWVLLFWIALNIWQGANGLGHRMESGSGVAYFAHIGGFFAGLIIIQILGGKNLVARQKQRAYNEPPRF